MCSLWPLARMEHCSLLAWVPELAAAKSGLCVCLIVKFFTFAKDMEAGYGQWHLARMAKPSPVAAMIELCAYGKLLQAKLAGYSMSIRGSYDPLLLAQTDNSLRAAGKIAQY